MIKVSSDLKAELKQGFQRHLNYSLGRTLDELTPTDAYISLSLSLRDLMMHRLIVKRRKSRHHKRVYYLSMEFLMGKMLNVALVNLNLRHEAAEILEEFGCKLDDLLAIEPDAALGNDWVIVGGLPRLGLVVVQRSFPLTTHSDAVVDNLRAKDAVEFATYDTPPVETSLPDATGAQPQQAPDAQW